MSAIPANSASVRPAGALGSGFRIWLRELPRLAVVAALVWVPYQLVQALLFTLFAVAANAATIDAAGGKVNSGQSVDAAPLAAPAAALAAYAVVSLVLSLLALSLAQGALSRVADSALAGAESRPGEALRHGFRRLAAILGANLVVGGLILTAELVIAVLAAVASFVAGFAGLAPVATGVGAVALIAAPILVFARLATAPQAAALDGCGPILAVARAADELRGRFLASLAVVVVTGAVAWAAAFVLQGLASAVFGGGTYATFTAALVAAVVAVAVGPLPQVALTALHRSGIRAAREMPTTAEAVAARR